MNSDPPTVSFPTICSITSAEWLLGIAGLGLMIAKAAGGSIQSSPSSSGKAPGAGTECFFSRCCCCCCCCFFGGGDGCGSGACAMCWTCCGCWSVPVCDACASDLDGRGAWDWDFPSMLTVSFSFLLLLLFCCV